MTLLSFLCLIAFAGNCIVAIMGRNQHAFWGWFAAILVLIKYIMY